MGKQGPCYHCGVTSTPLWRNGPPEKPVLCNACGSRWRTKGTLANYTPSRRDPVDTEELKVSKPRTIIFKPKEQFSYRRKQCDGIVEAEREVPYSGQNFRKKFEGDTSYRSSSGSATSYSESCGYLGTYDTNDLAGSAQSIIWDSLVPSKKRTGVTRPKPSPVEKLTKELHSILQEQPSYLSGSSEEDLLYECSTPIGSFEIGHGGVLVRSLDSKFVEEESEASSLPIDNKLYNINEAYSGSLSLSAHRENKRTGYPSIGIEKFKKSTSQLTEEHLMRISHEKLDILRDKNSPLSSIDLEGIANFEVFMKDTTQEEQHRLMRYLPSIDVVEAPESLKNMFQSPQFTETLSCFQQLLQEGIFDQSFSGENIEEFRSLKRLVLLNTTKSKWAEHYQKIKDVKHNQVSRGKEIAFKPHSLGHSDQTSLKRPRDHPNGNRRELKGLMRSPKRVFKSSTTNFPLVKSSQLNSSDAGSKVIYDSDDFVDNEGDCVSPRSIFASPPDRSCMLAPLQFFGENTDHDLLMDAPRNAPFPEAELLNHPWSRKTNQDSNQTESGVADGEESLTNKPSSSFGSRNQRHW